MSGYVAQHVLDDGPPTKATHLEHDIHAVYQGTKASEIDTRFIQITEDGFLRCKTLGCTWRSLGRGDARTHIAERHKEAIDHPKLTTYVCACGEWFFTKVDGNRHLKLKNEGKTHKSGVCQKTNSSADSTHEKTSELP